MKIVKADAKGRVTGLEAGEEYTRTENYEGIVTYAPRRVRVPESTKDITREEFEAFFGVPPNAVLAEDGIQVVPISGKGFLPHGIQVQSFLLEDGQVRLYRTGGTEAATSSTLIRVLRDPKDVLQSTQEQREETE